MILTLKFPPLHLRGFSLSLRPAFQRWTEMRAAIAGRHALAAMDARMLADIGLSACDAAEEISRKPWDTAPRHTRQSNTRPSNIGSSNTGSNGMI